MTSKLVAMAISYEVKDTLVWTQKLLGESSCFFVIFFYLTNERNILTNFEKICR